MAAHDPRNPGEFGQQGAEFVDIDEEVDDGNAGYAPEAETQQVVLVAKTKPLALCAKALPTTALYNATAAASVGLLKLRSLDMPFVAQAAVMRVGVSASAIGLVFVEMER